MFFLFFYLTLYVKSRRHSACPVISYLQNIFCQIHRIHFHIPGLDDLFTTLALAQAKLGSPQDREDLGFLQQFFHNSDVQHAVSIQHRVGLLQESQSPPLPVAANSETLAKEVNKKNLNSCCPLAGLGVGEGVCSPPNLFPVRFVYFILYCNDKNLNLV